MTARDFRFLRSLRSARLLPVLGLLTIAAPGFADCGSAHAADEKKRCSASAEVCIRAMADKLSQRGWVGIEMTEQDGAGRPVVTGIVAGSPAERAGFERGDVLISFNGVSHEEGEEAVNAEVQRAAVPGKTITIGVERDGRPVDLEVTLGRIPEYLLAQWVGQHMLEGHAGEEAPKETPRP